MTSIGLVVVVDVHLLATSGYVAWFSFDFLVDGSNCGGSSVSSVSETSVANSGDSGSSSNSVSSVSDSGDGRGGSSFGNVGDGVDWGGVSGDDSLAGVSLNGGVVDVRGLDDLLDGVDLVWGWDRDSTWNGNLVGLGDVVDLDDLTGNCTWDGDGDIDVVLLHVQLGNDVGGLG